VRAGDEIEILRIDDEQARVHAIRFGMADGARATCVTRVPAGPIVLRSGRQEVAIGRGLARRILVRRVADESCPRPKGDRDMGVA
jgi:Fe2+ transport system protein FeoA